MALLVKTGTYTGDGSDPKTISGVGFTPKVVMIFATSGTGDASAACFKTTEMSTGVSGQTANMGENGQQTDGLIDSFTSDGFLVRGQKNLNTVAYYYIALGGSDCVTGTYTGNGADNRSITGIGFLPKWLVIQGGGNFAEHKSTATGNTTDTSQSFSVMGDSSNLIQALEADGFQIGVMNAGGRGVNVNGVTYYYFALTGTNVTSGTYTGNGSDNRGITGVGFDPIGAIVKQSSTQQAVSRSGQVGDLSSLMRANTAPIVNAIQSLITDGFQIGTNATVNNNGSTYFWVAFGPHATPPADTSNFFLVM